MAEEQETKPKVEEAVIINLVVKDQEGEVHFKARFRPGPSTAGKVAWKYFCSGFLMSAPTPVQVKPHTKMQRIMNAYADKKSYEVNQIRFLYDGRRLTDQMTPEELDMEDGDVIDAVLVGAFPNFLA